MGIIKNNGQINPVIDGKNVAGILKNGSSVYKYNKVHIYGIKRSIDSDSSSWERIEDAVGLVANALIDKTYAVNDFDDLYPWSAIYTYSLNINTGKETRYDEPGFSYSDDYVLTKFPEFWWKREQIDGYEYIYIADGKVNGYIKSEEFSLGRYFASGSSLKLYSKSGASVFGNTDIDNFRIYAKKIGTNFGIMDWRYFLVQILYLVEYADYNSQLKLGYGVVNKTGNLPQTGNCNNYAMKSGGSHNNYELSMIYRGLENIFGCCYQFVDGINIKNYKAYVCYDPSKYQSNKFDDDYEEISYTNSTSSGKISKLGYSTLHSLIAFPISIKSGGGIDDGYKCESASISPCVGGEANSQYDAGLWCWDLRDASKHTFNTCARLLRYK